MQVKFLFVSVTMHHMEVPGGQTPEHGESFCPGHFSSPF